MDRDRSALEQRLYRLLPLAALLALALFGLRTVTHSGFWTHLAIGRDIAESGLPREDLWSFTQAGAPWVAVSWLYDVLIHMLFGIGGAWLVTLVHVAAVVAAVGVTGRLVREMCNPAPMAFSFLLAAWLLSYQFVIAPAVFVLWLPPLFLYIFSRVRSPWRMAAILLPLQLLWTNLHGSFWLGPALALLTAIQWQLDNDRAIRTRAIGYFALAVGLLIATVVNPYGLGLHAHVLQYRGAAGAMTEWISPFAAQFSYPMTGWLVILLLVVGGLGLLTLKQRLPVVWTVLAVVSVFAALRATPLILFMSILALPFLCLSMQAIADIAKDVFKKLEEERAQSIRMTMAAIAALLIVGTMISIVSGRYYRKSGSASSFGLGLRDDVYISGAVELMQRPDFPERCMNMAADGGYIRWHAPDQPLYIDQRRGVYPGEFTREWLEAVLGDADAWKKAVDQQRIDALVLNGCWTGSGGTLRYAAERDDWRLLYMDGVSAVLVRDTPAYQDLLADESIRQKGLDRLQEAYQAYTDRLTSAGKPPLPSQLIGAAESFFALGRFERALPILELLSRQAPNMNTAWFRMGRIRLLNGHTEKAIDALERSCELAGKNPLTWLWLSKAYAEADRTREANLAFQRCERLSPGTARAHGNPVE